MQQNIQEVFCNVWSAMSEKCRNTGVCCQMAEEKDYQSDGKEASEAEYITKQLINQSAYSSADLTVC